MAGTGRETRTFEVNELVRDRFVPAIVSQGGEADFATVADDEDFRAFLMRQVDCELDALTVSPNERCMSELLETVLALAKTFDPGLVTFHSGNLTSRFGNLGRTYLRSVTLPEASSLIGKFETQSSRYPEIVEPPKRKKK